MRVGQDEARHAVVLAQVLNRFGPREAFAGHVFTRNNELRLIPFRTVQRLAALPA